MLETTSRESRRIACFELIACCARALCARGRAQEATACKEHKMTTTKTTKKVKISDDVKDDKTWQHVTHKKSEVRRARSNRTRRSGVPYGLRLACGSWSRRGG